LPEGSWSLGQDFSLGLPEYKGALLSTLSWQSAPKEFNLLTLSPDKSQVRDEAPARDVGCSEPYFTACKRSVDLSKIVIREILTPLSIPPARSQMPLLVGLSERSVGRVRSSLLLSSSPPWFFTITFIRGMNNRPVGGCGSETSQPIDMINDMINGLNLSHHGIKLKLWNGSS
jgi:hypothetical protein